MYIGIKGVAVLPDYHLLLTFENSEQRVLDVRPYLDQGIFRELKDPSLFNSVRVQFDTIEWANGADLDPEMLYEESVSAVAEKV
jgi:hypothetical protein